MNQENSVAVRQPGEGIVEDVVLFVIAGFSTGVGVAILFGLLALILSPAVEAADLQPMKMDEVQRGSLYGQTHEERLFSC